MKIKIQLLITVLLIFLLYCSLQIINTYYPHNDNLFYATLVFIVIVNAFISAFFHYGIAFLSFFVIPVLNTAALYFSKKPGAEENLELIAFICMYLLTLIGTILGIIVRVLCISFGNKYISLTNYAQSNNSKNIKNSTDCNK